MFIIVMLSNPQFRTKIGLSYGFYCTSLPLFFSDVILFLLHDYSFNFCDMWFMLPLVNNMLCGKLLYTVRLLQLHKIIVVCKLIWHLKI